MTKEILKMTKEYTKGKWWKFFGIFLLIFVLISGITTSFLISDLVIYRVFGKYPLSEEDLDAIVNEGVIKIRFETTGGTVENSYPASESIRVGLKKTEGNLISMKLSPLYKDLKRNIDLTATF